MEQRLLVATGSCFRRHIAIALPLSSIVALLVSVRRGVVPSRFREGRLLRLHGSVISKST